MWSRRCTTSCRTAVVGMLLGIILALMSGISVRAGTWEMKVCADPNNLPFTNREGEGFDNRIAEILADELDADLTYLWWPVDARVVREKLLTGQCDMVMGIGDGYEGLLTTLAYYRSIYAFVYREESAFEITSFDDPLLTQLNVALEASEIPPHIAFVNRGLIPHEMRLRFVEKDVNQLHPLEPIMKAVASGEVDVAVVWGPVAGYFATRQEAKSKLAVVPVSPVIEPPFLPMTASMTIGVRPGDVAFRDRLNVAIARRWEEVQSVLEAYGVPLMPLPLPMVQGAGSTDQ